MKWKDPHDDDPELLPFEKLVAQELRRNPVLTSEIERGTKSRCLVCNRHFKLGPANKNRLGRAFCSSAHYEIARRADKNRARDTRRED